MGTLKLVVAVDSQMAKGIRVTIKPVVKALEIEMRFLSFSPTLFLWR
jgi:hypothetical protein